MISHIRRAAIAAALACAVLVPSFALARGGGHSGGGHFGLSDGNGSWVVYGNWPLKLTLFGME